LMHLGLKPGVIEKLRKFWFTLPRDECVVCGSRASDIDEFWSYYVSDGRGIVRQVSLRSLCGHCHLAKHIGYASTIGKEKWPLNT
jgi:5-methylcytosine-specific restriction endonuclease McrA